MAITAGDASIVLLKRHGATVVGGTLHDSVFTSVHSTANAKLLLAALPLYTVEDAMRASEQLTTAPFDRWFPVTRGVDVRYRRAGNRRR